MIQDAHHVNSKESLRAWLRENRRLARLGLVQEVKHVAVNKDFEITHIYFNEAGILTNDKEAA